MSSILNRTAGRLSGCAWLLGVWLVLCNATVALAQKPARLPEDDKGLVQWGIGAAIVILVGIVAFMNPKRSHLD